MTDAIKAALDAAAVRMCICDGECFETRHGMMNGPCEKRPTEAAPVIAAFLRAWPAAHELRRFDHATGRVRAIHTEDLSILADMVERTFERAGGGDA